MCELIHRMVEKDQNKRISIEEALAHRAMNRIKDAIPAEEGGPLVAQLRREL